MRRVLAIGVFAGLLAGCAATPSPRVSAPPPARLPHRYATCEDAPSTDVRDDNGVSDYVVGLHEAWKDCQLKLRIGKQ